MNSHQPPLRSLILLGGDSSRMGSPKYLLQIPSTVSESGEDTPFLVHALCLHHMFQVMHGDPLLRSVVLSVRDEAQRDEIKALLAKYEIELPIDLNVVYVQDAETQGGAAAGLLAAWRLDGIAHWLVTGCYFPLISKATLQELRNHHHQEHRAITCLIGSKDRLEPLLAIWTPAALAYLSKSSEGNGNLDVSQVLHSFAEKEDGSGGNEKHYSQGVSRLKPSNENCTIAVNEPEEWRKVEKYLQDKFAGSDPRP